MTVWNLRSRFKHGASACLLLALLGFTRLASAGMVMLADGFGVIDPVTYTTADGTFTTSPLALRLSRNAVSFFDFNESTGVIRSFTVFDLAFADGRGNDLVGRLTLDESGFLGAQPTLMTVTSGRLDGAGDFDGATVHGGNPALSPFHWLFRAPPADLRADLPAAFVNGRNTPLWGEVFVVPLAVPEPSSLVLASACLGLLGWSRRARAPLTPPPAG